ncbi:hypothetical protein PHISCL_02235 [Aspergillus sclerotialis]|uniref:AB hydrolase-1 domain-containing protein n=1 Tax=Aspergillus sclerotialis TaxID=2070753 RepID=A0A3A2ZQI0_9EURO|nr:hypothetical protein PHISCL_02235 [Aspergillus sclerotialis]
MDTDSQLTVKGASLSYRTIGTGPALILIPGGNGTAIFYESLAQALSSRFKVTIYDRRGFHRSPVYNSGTTPTGSTTMRTHAEDLAALITRVSPQGPASLFTCSGSATIATELLSYNPNLVHRVILHEPLFISLLPSPLQEKTKATGREVMTTYKNRGIGPANKLLMPLVHGAADWRRFKKTETYNRLASLSANNMTFYFENELPELVEYRVDEVWLAQFRDKLVLFIGSDMEPEPPSTSVRRLAEELQIALTTVEGGHSAYVTNVGETADAVIHTLLYPTSKI